ncbi:MAG: N-6 DNA methylase, partial [Gemmatimonadota bacterium]|nr:N-6 DNA methylase [Gemmatimonadota bacterium]
LGKADYVMANPPFNVDEIDADKVKTDPRLPFGLPGVNKENKVSSGNYVWISYFYSYLNETGRAGFVMSSQASSAGSNEAEVRRKLVETGDVEAMIAIRSNFFYTRTVPCELWFLNRAKPETHRDKVLMIDARNIYRQVTRKIYDFSPEQQQNILAIVHLYRGETDRFIALISNYLQRILGESRACFEINDGETIHSLPDFINALTRLHDLFAPSLKTLPKNGQHAETLAEYDKARTAFPEAIEQFRTAITETTQNTSTDLNKQVAEFVPLIEISRDLSERTDNLYKLAIRITDICESAGTNNNRSDITRARRTADEARKIAVEQLKQVNYFYQQAYWLTERFPEAKLCDVEGLVKLVDRAEIEANDWSLTPGRYVGVAPEEEDENFDFAEALREIHDEIEELNVEAVSLATTIKRNFEALL